jgi:hypothetical protein
MRASSTLLEDSSSEPAGLMQSYVFGLRVDSTLPLRAVGVGANTPSRGLVLRHVERAELAAVWPRDGIVPLIDRRTPSERLVMSVDAHPDVGYRIVAPGFGAHIVSPDGRSILSAIPAITAWRWQRLLFAQVLPLAATLQGLELFHASAVERAGRAYAFIAASGTGKSSIAAHLVSRGARYVADDVVALEAAQGIALAHPGPATASVYRSELQSLGTAGARRVGAIIGRSDKVQLGVEPVKGPLPLDGIYFVARQSSTTRFAIEEARPPDPRILLASSFISYLRTPAFLLGHLDACAQIAEAAPLFRVSVPPELAAADVAAAVERHAEAERD